MKLYAVTYTDDCEPWGADVVDKTLYATREDAEAKLNEMWAGSEGRGWERDDFDRCYAIGEYTVKGLVDPDRGRIQGTV